MTRAERKRTARDLRFLRGLCIDCARRRTCASARCDVCRAKAATYMRTYARKRKQAA